MKKKRRLRKKIASLYYNIQLCKFRKAVVKVTKSFKADPRPCDIPWGGGSKRSQISWSDVTFILLLNKSYLNKMFGVYVSMTMKL